MRNINVPCLCVLNAFENLSCTLLVDLQQRN